MEEILFVNEYARDKETFKEIYGYFYFLTPFRMAFNIGVLLYVILIIAYFGLWILEIPTVLVCFILMLLVSPVRYFISVNRVEKQDKQLCNGKPFVVTFSVSADKLIFGRAGSDYSIDISNVKYAFVTKNYVTVVLKSTRLLAIFKKDSFTTGDSGGFIAFLREKGIKVRGKKTV